MGLFNGVKIGDRVELLLTAVDVIDRGKDKHGVFLQTQDNRFYEDQETLQEVKIKQRARVRPRWVDGTIVTFDCYRDKGLPALYYLRVARGDKLYNLLDNKCEGNAHSGADYTVVYVPGQEGPK